MSEDIRNIGFVCKEHASKPDSKLAALPPEHFIGKYVKKSFTGRHPIARGEIIEHMWVKIEEVEGKTLKGKLANDPTTEMDIECGDIVSVELNEIEQVLL